MSLGVVVKGPEGIALAADTRITLYARRDDTEPPLLANYDNATKLLTFGEPHSFVAAVTYGDALIGRRTAHSFTPEFELELEDKRCSVGEYAELLSAFYKSQWEKADMDSDANPGMNFVVGGYDEDQPYGCVYSFNVPRQPEPNPRHVDGNFGVTWGGQPEIATRILHGYDPAILHLLKDDLGVPEENLEVLKARLKSIQPFNIPYEVLPLQDSVDLAIFLIRTTMDAQRLSVGVRGVGGSIEVASITRSEGLKWIQRKEIQGETR